MNDLKIIDELLCAYRELNDRTWKEVEDDSNINKLAMSRLKQAWQSREMINGITTSLAQYFDNGLDT